MATRIYDQAGELFARSATEAAGLLGIERPSLYALTEPYADGRRLTREPGRRYEGRETQLPDGPPLPSVAVAARVAGVSRAALYQRGREGEGGELLVRRAKRP
jgi:hypothetical protein